MNRTNKDTHPQPSNRQYLQVSRVDPVHPTTQVFDTQSTYPTTLGSMQNSTYGGVSSEFPPYPPAHWQVQFEPRFEPSQPYWRNSTVLPPSTQPSPISNMMTMYRAMYQSSASVDSRYPPYAYKYPAMQTQPNPPATFNFNNQSSPSSSDPESYSRRFGDFQAGSTFQQTTSTYRNDSLLTYQQVIHGSNNLLPIYPQPKGMNGQMFTHRWPESTNQTTTSSSATMQDFQTASSAASHCAQTNGKQGEIPNKCKESGIVCEEKDFSCVVCQDVRKNILIWPCRHLCVCEKCSQEIKLCPLCRKPINQLITVFT